MDPHHRRVSEENPENETALYRPHVFHEDLSAETRGTFRESGKIRLCPTALPGLKRFPG
jgi:hypothetical protein